MKRRAFLVGAAGSLAAASGCLGLDRRNTPVTDRRVTVLERGCGDEDNEIAPSYDEDADRLRVSGVLSGTTACGPLDVTYADNDASDRIIVEVYATDDGSCASCPRYYEYEATVSFREPPDVVAVAHSSPEDVMEMRALVVDAEPATSA
ncbi:hypothetical protein [Halobacterium hubeiense]|uniref:hypothetical protein n=1 Tax=Halobacterium hubeiense TaxID=1407499 RepID=UPI003C74B830